MKKCLLYLACTAIALSLTQACTQTSCLSPYKAGTDERSLGVYVSDTVIQDKIKARLLKDEDKAVREAFLSISVSVHRGRVVMVGEIPEKRVGERAIQIARSTKSVKKVDTYFLPKARKSTAANDNKIAATVKGRFLSDVDLKGFQVEVSVVHGHVVLAGLVANEFLKNRCITHASRVQGAVKVVDFIQVK